MNRLLLGNTLQDNSRVDVAPPYDTKVSSPILSLRLTVIYFQLCTADSMFPSGHAGLPHPHYRQLGPRHEDQVDSAPPQRSIVRWTRYLFYPSQRRICLICML